MILAKFKQSFKMAMKSITGNKGRSALTMLGIVIGVASVIILTGIGGGATKEITDTISEMGTNRITVMMTRGANSSRSIDLDDMQTYLEENPDLVSMMSPYLSAQPTVKQGNHNITTSLDACDTSYQTIADLTVESGRFFSDYEVENRKRVCVIGTYIMQELFGGVDPVGQSLKINGSVFEIVGMYEETDDSTEGSGDDKITIPYTTAQRFFRQNISTYYFYATSEDTVVTATDDIERYITTKLGTDEGFRVSNLLSLLDTLDEMTGVMTAMLAGIASISLIVGGIGIMNIMTVSVSERTREIGIRKAIGARTTDILTQFLIESVVLSGLGGIIGIILGVLVGHLIKMLGQTLDMQGLTFALQWNMVALSFIFSLAVGIFFGLAPAKKAAKLNPIEALRSE